MDLQKYDKEYWEFVDKKFKGYSLEKQAKLFTLYLDHILKYVDGKRSLKVLDIGCGYGHFLKLCEVHTSWELYGVDVSECALDKARRILSRTKLEKWTWKKD